MDLLKELSDLEIAIQGLQEQRKNLIAVIEQHVLKNGKVEAHGYVAKMAPGRKSTDHQAAAKAANVSEELIEKYSTVSVSVKWAELTKAAKVNTDPFTVTGDPVFTIKSTAK